MEATEFLSLLARTRVEAAGHALGDATPGYCRARLLTVTTVEAATAVVARAHALEGRPLERVTDAWSARTPNPITRARLREQGTLLLVYAGHTPAPLPRAVAAGVAAARGGIGAEDLARMIGFDDVQNVLAPAHPADAHAWSAGVLADVRMMAAQVAGLTETFSIPASGADLTVYAQAQ